MEDPTRPSTTVAEGVFATVSPSGRPVSPATGLAPRRRTVDGTRIAFVWDHVFRGDDIFRVLAEDPRTHWVSAFVPHGVFGNIHGNTQEEASAVDLLAGRLRENDVDAVVVGVGA